MRENLEAVLDLFAHPGFRSGLVAGLIAGVVLVLVRLLAKRPAHGWGVVFTGAVIAGLYSLSEDEGTLLWGVLALAAAGFVVDLVTLIQRRWDSQVPLLISWIPALVASWWFGTLLDPLDVSWIPPTMSLTVLALGAGIWRLGRSPVAEVLGPVFAVVVVGAWVTVPETDMMTVIVGAAVPLGLATLPPLRARSLSSGAMALAGVFAWLVMDGGLTRPWTVAGGWVVAGIIPLIALTVRSPLKAGPQVLVVLVSALYALVVTRVADFTDSAFVVAASGALLGAVAFGSLWLIRRRATPIS
jgi:hypothetical protein